MVAAYFVAIREAVHDQAELAEYGYHTFIIEGVPANNG